MQDDLRNYFSSFELMITVIKRVDSCPLYMSHVQRTSTFDDGNHELEKWKKLRRSSYIIVSNWVVLGREQPSSDIIWSYHGLLDVDWYGGLKMNVTKRLVTKFDQALLTPVPLVYGNSCYRLSNCTGSLVGMRIFVQFCWSHRKWISVEIMHWTNLLEHHSSTAYVKSFATPRHHPFKYTTQ